MFNAPNDEVVIVGGGVIGMSCAWLAAKAGLSVTVIDPAPGSGASHVAAGMLAAVTEAHFTEPELTAANVVSGEMWPKFASDLVQDSGQDIGFLTSGTLAVAADAGDWASLLQLADFLAAMNLDAKTMSVRAARQLEPYLSPSIRGTLFAKNDFQVDNRALHSALMVASDKAGVKILNHQVVALQHRLGQIAGVKLRDGSLINASKVVLSAGAWTSRILSEQDGFEVPVRPVKGHILRLQSPPGLKLLTRTVRALVHGRPVYIVPRSDERIVIGATTEEVGFDNRVQVGPVADLLQDARTILPGIAECELVESSIGFRPGSPDNRPLIGSPGSAAPQGLLIASGHYRNGILLAPFTAQCILNHLRDEASHPAAQSLAASRFSSKSDQRPFGSEIVGQTALSGPS